MHGFKHHSLSTALLNSLQSFSKKNKKKESQTLTRNGSETPKLLNENAGENGVTKIPKTSQQVETSSTQHFCAKEKQSVVFVIV